MSLFEISNRSWCFFQRLLWVRSRTNSCSSLFVTFRALLERTGIFIIKPGGTSFREGSRVRQTPEEGRRTYRLKRCGNNNKDDDNSLKNLNDKNQQASSQKFRQLVFISLMKFLLCSLVSSSFYRSPEKFFSSFFSLIWQRPLRIFLNKFFSFVSFFFSGRSDFFLICYLYSFYHSSFTAFHYKHGTFFNTKFHLYIFTVCIHCLYLGLQFFLIFGKQFDVFDVY